MSYRVVMTEAAESEIEEAVRWWLENGSQSQVLRWHEDIIGAIESLAEHPQRCPVARENDRFPFKVHEFTSA